MFPERQVTRKRQRADRQETEKAVSPTGN